MRGVGLLMSIGAMLAFSTLKGDLIPREKIFQNSACLGIKISPDRKRFGFVGSDENGIMNLYVTRGLSLEEKEQLTYFTEPEIRNFYWSADGTKIAFLKDKDGTRAYHLYVVSLESLEILDLTENDRRTAVKVFKVSTKEPKIVIGINDRNSKFHDLYQIDLNTNELSLLYQNDRYLNFVFDDDLKVVLKVELHGDSSLSFWDLEDRETVYISDEDAFHTECLRVCDGGEGAYFLDTRSSNTTTLKKIGLNEPYEVVLGNDLKSDITQVIFENGEPTAYATYFKMQEWHPLEEKIGIDLAFLTDKLGPNFRIIDQSLDSKLWVVQNALPESGGSFWLFDRNSQTIDLLYQDPLIEGLSKMYPLVIPSRDGYELVSYLTLPKTQDLGGFVSQSVPLVIIPHGGPFKARDYYGYSNKHQWLANRGYAVLSVNFRLSSGFGKEFVNLGNGQWGKKAHEDILDAADWCITQGIAKKESIAVFGGSYGGYEALTSLTVSSDQFACAVAICGPSNLKTVLDKLSFYWEIPEAPFSDKTRLFTKNAFIKSMGGDPENPEGVLYLQSISPLEFVDQIQKPLLLIHGENDPIVAGSESDQIFKKMQEKGRPVIYLSFPDEGHGICKKANEMCVLAYTEKFLQETLGGECEAIEEVDLKASSVKELRVSR